MDRELLIEIGVEEIPASWLPELTVDLGTRLDARLKELRLPPAAPIETYSTPRRLTVRVGRLAERQTDFEEVLNGPPVSAAFDAGGQPTPAALGFAKKNNVEVAALERLETAKGIYLAYRKQVRGKAAVDVLPDVLSGLLRELKFPKAMNWDATLDDGSGDLPFGRPIRWILFLYGGRVVPFSIYRTARAQGPLVQEIRSGAVTFGHRFLTTSGRAGRAIKVKGFDDYRKRLAENFVMLERRERHERIQRELDSEARRRGGRVSRQAGGQSLLQEVPDLVEYPKVVSGTFAEEFLSLPEEVLTTTMIHHQHFFPLVNEHGRLQPVFLAVLNMESDRPELISRNLERVLTARLRDARFFFDADRRRKLEPHLKKLGSVLFHKQLGSYAEKAERIGALAAQIARDTLRAPDAAEAARLAGRLAKADLATDMVREMTDLQGTMGGIYAREDGQPEPIWKAIYFHYLPVGVEADAAPSKEQLGSAATTWAAVSLADKLDTLVGMFAAGERPTGSRDPYGLRRAAQGIVKLLADLQAVIGRDTSMSLEELIRAAAQQLPGIQIAAEDLQRLHVFLVERLQHLMQARGLGHEEVKAATGDIPKLMGRTVADTVQRGMAFRDLKTTPDFIDVAAAYKRANNIVEAERASTVSTEADWKQNVDRLVEPAELALRRSLDEKGAIIRQALNARDYRRANAAIASLKAEIYTFFDSVLVNVDGDEPLRNARLSLLTEFRDRVREMGDISALIPSAQKAAKD
jgi:glycyl-tRNA synthetase beta chain